MIGGSSVDKVRIVVSLDVQVKPVTDCPLALTASIVRVSPTTMLITFGTKVTAVPSQRVTGIVTVIALLHTPLCRTFTTPLTAVEAMLAAIVPSLHAVTIPGAPPIETPPLPCEFPKPLPVIVIDVEPALPEVGLMFRMCGKFIVNGKELLQVPFWRT
jgi:hypothetical protein